MLIVLGELSLGWLESVWKGMLRMCRSRLVNVRLSERQYNLLINRMEAIGYRNMSQFIRDSCLRDDLSTLKLLRDIHEKIIGGEKNEA
jgi:hypothetical protein